MNEKIFIKCNFCNKKSKFNLQKVWIKYNVDATGNYDEDRSFDTFDVEEPINEDNIHLCEICFEKWLNKKT